jgi:hypothetical protein
MKNFSRSKTAAGRRFSRRGFVRAGSLLGTAITLPGLLRAAEGKPAASYKSVINIHLDGGPPQMDLIDPKPDAPSEIRGVFDTIPTAIPGVRFTELIPRLAKGAKRYAFLRALVGAEARHDAFQCQSGFAEKDLVSMGGRPALGCVVSHLLGRPTDPAPSFVDLMQGRPLARNSARPGFLGAAYRPFRPDLSHLFKRELEPGMQEELARLGEGHTLELDLVDGITVKRLENRIELMRDLDGLRRDIDQMGSMNALDSFTQQAMGILSSGRFAEALDLNREDPRVVEKYTPRIKTPGEKFYTTEGPEAARKFLIARRMVEAGVKCVSVSLSDFDTHSSNFDRMRYLGPLMDHAIDTLVADLEERGMLDDVLVVAWGEFGRTPKVNEKAGRDHWPRVAMGIMAGGGIEGGQVIGATDRTASEAIERPVHYQDVIATLYRHLGIDGRTTTVLDTQGRPQHLVKLGKPLPELS